MSRIQEVVALIEERGSGTVDDILPDMEGSTRAQVLSALSNAKQEGLLLCDGPNKSQGYKGRGSRPGVYRARPPAKPSRLPPASVWEFAARA